MNGLTCDTGDLFTGWTVKPHCHVCWWLMVSMFPLFDPSVNNQQPGRRNIWGSVSTGRSSDFGRGGRVAHVFKRFSALHLLLLHLHLLFASFGLLAWETVTGRQLQCEKNLSSNRPTFVKNRSTIDIKTKATSYENILIPDVVTIKKYDVRNIALTI